MTGELYLFIILVEGNDSIGNPVLDLCILSEEVTKKGPPILRDEVATVAAPQLPRQRGSYLGSIEGSLHGHKGITIWFYRTCPAKQVVRGLSRALHICGSA